MVNILLGVCHHAIRNSFKCIYFLKLIGTGARQGGGVDSGIRFRGDSESIRRGRPFPVHVTAAKGRRREGTGRKGEGGNNTGV